MVVIVFVLDFTCSSKAERTYPDVWLWDPRVV